MCRPSPCGPFCFSCLPPSILLSSSRHSWPSPPAIVPSVHPSSRPLIRPSGCPSIQLSIQPSFVLPFLAAPAFPLVSFAAVSHPGPYPGAFIPGPCATPISSTAPALLSDRPSLGILPESLSRESFQSIVPGNCSRTACLPQSFSPPATRLPSVLPSCGTVAQLSVDKAQGAFLPLAEGKASFLLQSHLF